MAGRFGVEGVFRNEVPAVGVQCQFEQSSELRTRHKNGAEAKLPPLLSSEEVRSGLGGYNVAEPFGEHFVGVGEEVFARNLAGVDVGQ